MKVKVSDLIKEIIPKLKLDKLKGDNGIIAVIGGSIEYTGAPYYSGISALKSGSDLVHVFCHTEAAIPIKCYSPELMVHPAFNDDPNNEELLSKTSRWFKSMHVLAYGPGFGRSETTERCFDYFLGESFKLDKVIKVFDADSLWFLNRLGLDKFKNNSFMILTPNKGEFDRLYKTYIEEEYQDNTQINEEIYNNIFSLKEDIIYFEGLKENHSEYFFKREIQLAKKLNNKIILKKGPVDIITDGLSAFIVCTEGSYKRTGGLGDILTGIVSSYIGMIRKEHNLDNIKIMKACALASYICRCASKMAYEKYKLAMTAPDVINELVNITKTYDILI